MDNLESQLVQLFYEAAKGNFFAKVIQTELQLLCIDHRTFKVQNGLSDQQYEKLIGVAFCDKIVTGDSLLSYCNMVASYCSIPYTLVLMLVKQYNDRKEHGVTV